MCVCVWKCKWKLSAHPIPPHPTSQEKKLATQHPPRERVNMNIYCSPPHPTSNSLEETRTKTTICKMCTTTRSVLDPVAEKHMFFSNLRTRLIPTCVRVVGLTSVHTMAGINTMEPIACMWIRFSHAAGWIWCRSGRPQLCQAPPVLISSYSKIMCLYSSLSATLSGASFLRFSLLLPGYIISNILTCVLCKENRCILGVGLNILQCCSQL